GVDELGALLEQRVTAARLRRMNRAWNREDVLALFSGLPGRDQRARFQCRLHHQSALAQTCDDPVAFREVGRQGWGTQWVFADQKPALCDAPGKFQVLARINPVQSGAD